MYQKWRNNCINKYCNNDTFYNDIFHRDVQYDAGQSRTEEIERKIAKWEQVCMNRKEKQYGEKMQQSRVE